MVYDTYETTHEIDEYGSYPSSYGTRLVDLSHDAAGKVARAARLIEIGCCMGHSTNWLSKQTSGQVVGCDISVGALRKARAQYPHVSWVAADASGLLPFSDATFDAAFSSDLIEHLNEVSTHLVEVRRLLKPGGIYICKTPNGWLDRPYWVANGMARRLREQGFVGWLSPIELYRRARTAAGRGHCSRQTFGSLRRLLASHGFSWRSYCKQRQPSPTQQQKLRSVPLVGSLLLQIAKTLYAHFPVQCQFSIVGVFKRD